MTRKKATEGVNPPTTNLKRSMRLRQRISEINSRSEKELATIFASIEKAKAAFRSQKS